MSEQEAEGVAGGREEQVQYASIALAFPPVSYERRKAVELGADAQLDVTTGSTVVGSSMEPDTPTKWPSGRPPPTARKPLYPFQYLAQTRLRTNTMETKLKTAYAQIC